MRLQSRAPILQLHASSLQPYVQVTASLEEFMGRLLALEQVYP